MTAHRLADGAEVKLGMRVVDYDRKHGTILDNGRNAIELTQPHVHRTSTGITPIEVGQDATHTCESWFDVQRDDGTTRGFDCSRLIAEGGRLDR